MYVISIKTLHHLLLDDNQYSTICKLTKAQVIRAPRLAGDRNPRQANTTEKIKTKIRRCLIHITPSWHQQTCNVMVHILQSSSPKSIKIMAKSTQTHWQVWLVKVNQIKCPLWRLITHLEWRTPWWISGFRIPAWQTVTCPSWEDGKHLREPTSSQILPEHPPVKLHVQQ